MVWVYGMAMAMAMAVLLWFPRLIKKKETFKVVVLKENETGQDKQGPRTPAST